MRARRAPTGTVESTGTSIAKTVPDAGEGISVSTLSVETSRSGSSTSIESPTFFSQRVTVPSVTDSPKAGIVTTTPLEELDGVATTGAGGAGGATGTGGASTTGATGVGATGASTTTGATGAALAEAPSSITASSAPTGTVASTATTIF